MEAWRKRAVKGIQVICALERVVIGRSVSMGMKKGIKNSIILPTLHICIRNMDVEYSTAITNTLWK